MEYDGRGFNGGLIAQFAPEFKGQDRFGVGAWTKLWGELPRIILRGSTPHNAWWGDAMRILDRYVLKEFTGPFFVLCGRFYCECS